MTWAPTYVLPQPGGPCTQSVVPRMESAACRALSTISAPGGNIGPSRLSIRRGLRRDRKSESADGRSPRSRQRFMTRSTASASLLAERQLFRRKVESVRRCSAPVPNQQGYFAVVEIKFLYRGRLLPVVSKRAAVSLPELGFLVRVKAELVGGRTASASGGAAAALRSGPALQGTPDRQSAPALPFPAGQTVATRSAFPRGGETPAGKPVIR